VAVVLSLRAYEELQASASREELRSAVSAAEEQVIAGSLVSSDTVDALLDDWSKSE
jgi:hypothetical protein